MVTQPGNEIVGLYAVRRGVAIKRLAANCLYIGTSDDLVQTGATDETVIAVPAKDVATVLSAIDRVITTKSSWPVIQTSNHS